MADAQPDEHKDGGNEGFESNQNDQAGKEGDPMSAGKAVVVIKKEDKEFIEVARNVSSRNAEPPKDHPGATQEPRGQYLAINEPEPQYPGIMYSSPQP